MSKKTKKGIKTTKKKHAKCIKVLMKKRETKAAIWLRAIKNHPEDEEKGLVECRKKYEIWKN